MVESMLVIRLGAMGDILHALPAAASLKQSFPERRLVWVTRPKWSSLFDGNPFIDEVIPFERRTWSSVRGAWTRLREIRPELAFDFQGLIQSALVGRASRPRQYWGFSRHVARERLAASFYTRRAEPPGPHRLQRNLQLVQAAGATQISDQTWVPLGQAEGDLPDRPFVLANPFAGWGAKQWPLSRYAALAKELAQLDTPLVLNVAPQQAESLKQLTNVRVHCSSIAGLIHATRCAAAVVGVDSGPLHLAAALRKPGVALYGPTDPATHGPYGGSMTVLRSPDAETTYKRLSEVHSSMQAITVGAVLAPLREVLDRHAPSVVRCS